MTDAVTTTKDETIRLQDAEIKQLRKSLDDHLDSEAAETRRADRERDRARAAEAEIERLRGLLREAPKHPMTESLKRRVREALGE